MTRTRGGNLTHGCNYEKSKIVIERLSSHKMERDTALCTMHREHSIHDIHVYAYVHTCVRTMYTLTCIYAYVMPWMHTHTRTCHTLEMSCSYELLSVPCILCSCTQFILPTAATGTTCVFFYSPSM